MDDFDSKNENTYRETLNLFFSEKLKNRVSTYDICRKIKIKYPKTSAHILESILSNGWCHVNDKTIIQMYNENKTFSINWLFYFEKYGHNLQADDQYKYAQEIKNNCKGNKELMKYSYFLIKGAANNGCESALEIIDPWKLLSISDERDIIIEALNSWTPEYNKNKYHYSTLKNNLGRQILDFLEWLVKLSHVDKWESNNTTEEHNDLKEEMEIMICVRNRDAFDHKRHWRFRDQNGEHAKMLRLYENNDFAKYVVKKSYYLNFNDIAGYLVREVFLKRINS